MSVRVCVFTENGTFIAYLLVFALAFVDFILNFWWRECNGHQKTNSDRLCLVSIQHNTYGICSLYLCNVITDAMECLWNANDAMRMCERYIIIINIANRFICCSLMLAAAVAFFRRFRLSWFGIESMAFWQSNGHPFGWDQIELISSCMSIACKRKKSIPSSARIQTTTTTTKMIRASCIIAKWCVCVLSMMVAKCLHVRFFSLLGACVPAPTCECCAWL